MSRVGAENPMHAARIAELLHPFLQEASDQRPTTNDDLYQHISTYIDILLRWNAARQPVIKNVIEQDRVVRPRIPTSEQGSPQ